MSRIAVVGRSSKGDSDLLKTPRDARIRMAPVPSS